MTSFTVKHWVIADTQDQTKLDTYSSPSKRYDDLTGTSIPQDNSDSRINRLQSYPFNSKPFTIEIIAHQLYNTSPNKKTESVIDQLESDITGDLRVAEIPTVAPVSKTDTKTREPVFTKNTFASIIKRPPSNKSTPAADQNKSTNTPTTEVKPDLVFNARGQGNYEVATMRYVLDFHIPPSQISYEYGHELARNKTRGGWIMERWGERLVNIEVEGSSGMFFHDKEGLTRVHANATYGYFELMNLLQIYRNNGLSYDPQSGTVYTVGEVRIYYGDLSWTGSFDSFDIKENADSPYRFNYNFSFVSRGQLGDVNVRGHYIETSADVSMYAINSQQMMSRVLSGYSTTVYDATVGIPSTGGVKTFAENVLKSRSGRTKLFIAEQKTPYPESKATSYGTQFIPSPDSQNAFDSFTGKVR